MGSICQECSGEFTPNCQILQFCQVHNRKCFRCKNCRPQIQSYEPIHCNQCEQTCDPEQSFFDVRCQIYFCKREFKDFDASKHTVNLPCGCTELTQHMVAFMSDFCKGCLRTMRKSPNHQLRYCQLCEKKHTKETPQPPKTKVQKQEKKSLKETLDQLFMNSVSASGEQSSKKQESDENQKAIVNLLNQDIKRLKEQLDISQFTRMELRKKILEPQRDKQCLICTLPYSTLRKPMMICMQQHLSCQVCLKQNEKLVKCPLCSQTIQKDKIRPSRERLRTLQMEHIAAERFVNKINRYNKQFKSITEARYKYQIKDSETQTVQVSQPPLKVQQVEVDKKKQKAAAKAKANQRKNGRVQAQSGRKMKKV